MHCIENAPIFTPKLDVSIFMKTVKKLKNFFVLFCFSMKQRQLETLKAAAERNHRSLDSCEQDERKAFKIIINLWHRPVRGNKIFSDPWWKLDLIFYFMVYVYINIYTPVQIGILHTTLFVVLTGDDLPAKMILWFCDDCQLQGMETNPCRKYSCRQTVPLMFLSPRLHSPLTLYLSINLFCLLAGPANSNP